MGIVGSLVVHRPLTAFVEAGQGLTASGSGCKPG